MLRVLTDALRRTVVAKAALALLLASLCLLLLGIWQGARGDAAAVAIDNMRTQESQQPVVAAPPADPDGEGRVVPIAARTELHAAASPPFSRYFGYALYTLVGALLLLLFFRHVGRPLADVTRALERLARGERAPVLGKSGRTDEIGRLIRAVEAVRESLERMEAEAASLRGALAEKTLLLEQAPVGLLAERGALIVGCNSTFERLFGYQAGELIGRPLHLLYTAETAATEAGAGIPVANGEWCGEAQLRRKDGSSFWGALQCTGEPGASGEGVRIWACSDISEGKRAAIEKDERCQWLERLVAERNSQIEAFRQVAEAGGRGRHSPGAEQAREAWAEVHSFDLGALLGDLGDLLSIQAEEKGLELVMDIDPGLPDRLLGNPMRFGELLGSLMSHVIAKCSEGDIVLSVREECRHEHGLRLRCSICAGGGSGGRALRRPRGSKGRGPAQTRRAEGDPLGLAIARGLAEEAGSRLEIEDKDGQAFAFNFGIGFGIAGVRGEERASLYADRLRALAGRRVLVVDDSRSSRLVTGALLTRLGFVPTLFDSGWSALASLSSPESPSYLFICTDLDMPELNGADFARRLRAHYGRATPPLLLMAAAGRSGLPKGLAAAFAAVVPKPLGLERLFVQVAVALGISPAAAVNPSAGRALLPPTTAAGKRILLAAEASPAQEALADWLRDAGMRVRPVYSGIEILQAVREQAPDCLLIDCCLPALDGCETAVRLRSLGYSELPIIALVAHADTNGSARCHSGGINEVVVRPGDFRPLAAALKRWLAGPAAKAVEPEEQLLSSLPGLDLESGLRHLQGKTGLLLKALRTFRDSWGQQFLLEFRAAVAAADWPAAGRLAANLKSHAATIGATEVSATAARIEATIGTADYAAVPPLLAELSEKLRIIVEGLARIR